MACRGNSQDVSAPEQLAREVVDTKLSEPGWVAQSREALNLSPGPGVAIRESVLEEGHGHADYLLLVDGNGVRVRPCHQAVGSSESLQWRHRGLA